MKKKLKRTVVAGLAAATLIPAATAPVFAESNQEQANRNVRIDFVAGDKTIATVNKKFNELDKDGSLAVNDKEILEVASKVDALKNYIVKMPAGDLFGIYGDAEVKINVVEKGSDSNKNGTTVNIVFKDEEGNKISNGSFVVDKDGNGIANFSELTLPEGYELCVTGDFFVKEFAANEANVVKVRKATSGTKVNIVFQDEKGNPIGGGDYIIDKDGDGIVNFSELEVPFGYETCETGDFQVADFVKNESNVVKVKKVTAGTIVNVTFQDEEGNELGGGDYLIDKDEDGVANFSELIIPEGYELVVTGDFPVKEFAANKTNVVKVRKTGSHEEGDESKKGTKINVTFQDEEGNKVGEGEFVVDIDGDGVANYSEIAMPEGYVSCLLGDFPVSEFTGEGEHVVKVRKITEGTVINLVFVDEKGNKIMDSQYRVDMDGDGIANWSEVTFPGGYEPCETGDFFVKDYVGDKPKEVKVRKAIHGTAIHVIFSHYGEKVDEGTYYVDSDENGKFDVSEIPAPKGYKVASSPEYSVNDFKDAPLTVNVYKEGETVRIQVDFFDVDEKKVVTTKEFDVKPDENQNVCLNAITPPEGFKFVTAPENSFISLRNGTHFFVEVKKMSAKPTAPAKPADQRPSVHKGVNTGDIGVVGSLAATIAASGAGILAFFKKRRHS